MLKVLALVLVIAAAVALCASCSRKEEAKDETVKMNISISNQTGEPVTDISLKEKTGKGQGWNVGRVAAGAEVSVTIVTVTEKGAPNVELSFTGKSGQTYQTMILEKGDKYVVLKAEPEGGCAAEITSK